MTNPNKLNKDNSNNLIIKDNSANKNINLKIINLDNEENKCNNNYNNHIRNNLNLNNNNIIIKDMNDILNTIRRERSENKKKLVIKNNLKICQGLDNIKKSTTIKKNDKNMPLKLILNKIDNDYNNSFNFLTPLLNSNESNKKKTLMYKPLYNRNRLNITIPPPPPLPIRIPLPKTPSIIKEKINIDVEINNINDLLKLIDDYPIKFDVEYNINMKSLHNIKNQLLELNGMIGMNNLKDSVVDQILYYLQNLDVKPDFMHTVIYGPPGTGKTELAKIIGRIFASLGILKQNKFKKATRADLVAGYLGQTAIKTKEMLDSCLGGVLFIDEAYALGNSEKRDSFAKECIDTICEALSDNKDNLMVIIAGYENELNNCFFSYNEGLNSRFPWRFHTDDYNANELKQIFEKKIKDIGWSLKDTLKDEWFEKKMEYFKYYGRDMETLLAKIKISHSRRVFCKEQQYKTIITIEDMDKGFDLYLKNGEVKDRKKIDTKIPNMYL
jgi:AAA+ superfamily predicted ATPase